LRHFHEIFVMRSASAASLTILAAAASALRLPSAATRREIIGGSAALALGALAPAAVADSKKGYLTMSEVLEREKKEKQDQKLYGQFESLRFRAGQTDEFGKLAAADDFGGVATLARAWDSTIRQPLLSSAVGELDKADKARGSELDKLVLNDLKGIEKLAKGGKKDEMPAASTELQKHVVEFTNLMPQRLANKFGGFGDVTDL